MKQRILLMTIAIAFLFTGLASATCYLNDVQDDKSEYESYLNVSLVINNATTPYTAEMELTNDTMLFFPNAEVSTVLLNVPMDQIASATDSNGNTLNVTDSSGENPFDNFSTAISGEDNISNPLTITFEDTWNGTLPESAAGYSVAVEIQNIGENDADSAWVSLGFCEEEMAGSAMDEGTANESTTNESMDNESIANESMDNESMANESMDNESVTDESMDNESMANESMDNESQEDTTNGAVVANGEIVETNAVSVSDSGISPANIRVAVDAGVTWTNDGNGSFTINEFDSGPVEAGSMYSRLFRSSGVYEYTVEIGGESYPGTVTVGNGGAATDTTTTENVTDTTNVSDMNASNNVSDMNASTGESENMTESNVTEGNATDANVTEGNVTENATIAATVAGNESFSTLLTALEAANLSDTLDGEGPFTVFAPTDDAFDQLPDGTVEALLADEEALNSVLTYHVVSGEYNSTAIVELDNLTTVQGEDIAISVDNGTVMINNATVIAADIKASNGVIHVIDEVLIPPSMEEDMANMTPTTNASDMNASTSESGNMTDGNATEDNATEGNVTTVPVIEGNATDANVTEGNVTEGNVTEGNVTEGNVTDANVTDANVTEGNVTEGNVTEGNVTEGNVTDANVTEGNVTEGNVTDANVTEGNLTRCYLNVVEDNKSQYDGQLNATAMIDTQNSMAQLDLTNDTKEMFPNSTVNTILLNVPADQIMNANDSLGNEWLVVDIQEMENPFGFFLTKITTDEEEEGNPFGDFMTMIAVNESAENSTGPATIYFNETWNGTLPENEDGYVIATDVQNIGEAGNDSAWITLGFCEAAEDGTMPPADGGEAMDNVTCYLNTVEDSKSEYDGMLNASLMVNNETAPYSAEIEIMNETMAEFPNVTINTILLNVPGDMIENVTDSHGSWTILDQGAGTVLMMITSNQTEPTDGPITIYFNDSWNGTLPVNDAGYKIAVDFRNIGEMEDDSAWVTCGNETMTGDENMTNESQEDTTSGAVVANGEIVETNAVSVSDSGITPANIRVAVDAGVTWTNDGNESFSINEFDSGPVEAGSMYSRLFRSSGVYEYTVEIGGESYPGTVTVGNGGAVTETTTTENVTDTTDVSDMNASTTDSENVTEEETTDEETVDDTGEDVTEEETTDEETVDDTGEDVTEEETTDEETVDDTGEETEEETTDEETVDDAEDNMTEEDTTEDTEEDSEENMTA